MASSSDDHFQHKAEGYERARNRVVNVENIARTLLSTVVFHSDMQLMDFGSGTGLLLERVASRVGKVTAVDISPSMNAQLEGKREQLGCVLELLPLNLSTESLPIGRKFDAVVSSMTLHHVEDIAQLFEKFHGALLPGGVLAIADLDVEDGRFHSDDTGVFHCGFERKHLRSIALAAGFERVDICDASIVKKPQGDFPVFLLTAYRD